MLDVFLSLSRMMKEGIGPGKTREDHNNVFMQSYAAYAEGCYLREISTIIGATREDHNNVFMQSYAAYAEGCYLREISTIIGAEALGERDKIYLTSAEEFEKKFIAQGEREKRTIEDTLDIAWELFSALPEA